MGRLIRVVAPHFVAGITESPRLVAPIVRELAVLGTDEIITYCTQKGWKVEILMNEKIKMKGVVKWSGGNQYKGKTLWSFTLNGEDGFFGCGISDPKVKKGDTIEFDYEVVNGRAAVIMDTINLINSAPTNSVGNSKGGSSDSSGRRDAQYWEEKNQRDIDNDEYRRNNDIRIQYQSARNAAIEVAGILVTAGLIQIPEKKGAGYDVVMGKIEDLTNEFFHKTSAVGTQGTPEAF